jgi:hypothetical protein
MHLQRAEAARRRDVLAGVISWSRKKSTLNFSSARRSAR